MGIRETQWYGLHERAHKIVAGNQIILYHDKIERTYPDGSIDILEYDQTGNDVKEEQYDHIFGMFEEELPLMRYIFPDGRIYEEHVQAHWWSSGPMFFTALKDAKTGKWIEESKWLQFELDSM